VYVLKLASSLSRNIYEYTLDEVQFVANTSYKHFTLKFQPQVSNILFIEVIELYQTLKLITEYRGINRIISDPQIINGV